MSQEPSITPIDFSFLGDRATSGASEGSAPVPNHSWGQGLRGLNIAPDITDFCETLIPASTASSPVGGQASLHAGLVLDDLAQIEKGPENLAEILPPAFQIDEQIANSVKEVPPHQWSIGTLPPSPSMELPDLFRGNEKKPSLNLSDPSSGILQRKTTRNISEVAGYFIRLLNFANVGHSLAIYRNPHWELFSQKDSSWEFLRILNKEKSPLAQYLKSSDCKDIYDKILASADIPQLQAIPDIDSCLLCCSDGMYDWTKNRCCPSSSSYFRFCHLHMKSRDIYYQSTPYFDQFMDNTTRGDDDLRQLLLEIIGVIISGYPIKRFFVFEGVPNSGKSQLSNFLKEILGVSACVAVNDINQLGNRWTPGMLPGKLLCICADVPDKPLKPDAVGVIKKLTGDDPISGERKYENPFTFQNTAKLLFLSNAPLRLANGNHDAGFSSRILRVPFYHAVPENQRIPSLHKKLYREAGGIIWLALQALKQLDDRNGVFTQVEVHDYSCANSCISSELSPQELIQEFISHRCSYDPAARINAHVLHEAFSDFVSQHYPNSAPISSSYFGRCMNSMELPIEFCRTASNRYYQGLRLVDNQDDISF